MAELRRFMRIAALAAVLVLTASGCGTATPASPPPAAAPAPISVYTLAEPLHRTPFAIDWDAASGSFCSSTCHVCSWCSDARTSGRLST